MPASDVMLEPGAVLAGKYRIERVIGQGGMGIVAAAHHIQLEQRVALKLMLPHAMVNQEAVSRFLREARAAARISSEHVARVFDVGSLETGAPFIAMEYLEGSDIAQLLAAQGSLPFGQAIDYLLQACEALAEAHVAGIIHRDLKPGNLFLAQRLDGQVLVKVLDFGISKMIDAGAHSNAPVTHTSALMGSPLYMSPEQMGSAKAVDARSDVWALGVVLYEMLSGTPPFSGETLPQVCGMVLNEAPLPLNERAPGLPPVLCDIVARCLLKAPAERFQSVAELARALAPFGSARAWQSLERISRVQKSELMPAAAAITNPPPGAPPGTYAPWGQTKPPTVPRRRTAPVVAGVLALACLGAGGLWLAQRPASNDTAAPPLVSVAAPSPNALAAASVVSPAAVAPLAAESAPPPPPELGAPIASGRVPAVRRRVVPEARTTAAVSASSGSSPAPVAATSDPPANRPPLPVSTRSRL